MRSLALRFLSVSLFFNLPGSSLVEFELPLELGIPRLESFTASLPIAGNCESEEECVAVQLELAYDEKGRIICGGECLVDGSRVRVKGRIRVSRGSLSYKITLRGIDEKIRVKIGGECPERARVSYWGAKGRFNGEVGVTLATGAAEPGAAFIFPRLDEKGRITGTGNISSGRGFGEDGSVMGTHYRTRIVQKKK